MLKAIRGFFRDGRVELAEPVPGGLSGAVVVTFLEPPATPDAGPLEQRGLTKQEAAEIRRQLASFDEDWNAPGMDAYDRL